MEYENSGIECPTSQNEKKCLGGGLVGCLAPSKAYTDLQKDNRICFAVDTAYAAAGSQWS